MKQEKSEYYAGIIDKGTLDAIASGGNVENVSNEHNMLNADWSEQHMSHEELKEQITFILMFLFLLHFMFLSTIVSTCLCEKYGVFRVIINFILNTCAVGSHISAI